MSIESVAFLMKNLGTAIQQFPDLNWTDALSLGQLKSKLWLIEELDTLYITGELPGVDLGKVFVLAGWVGILPALMFQKSHRELPFDKIRSFDIDPRCALAADTVNREQVLDDWRFKASTADIFELDYDACAYRTTRANGSTVDLVEIPDTIVNTSCDHITPFANWYQRIPPGKLLVLQNNDFKEADETHTNTVANLQEFAAQTPMRKVLYEGSLQLPDYTRFMRIGIR